MVRHEEVRPSKHSLNIEMVGHSILRHCWEYAPRRDFEKPINFNIYPGATAPVLLLHLKQLAKDMKKRKIRCIFGIDFVQNSVRCMSPKQFEKMLRGIRHFFEVDMGEFHHFFYVNCIRCPELLAEGYEDSIQEINTQLQNENYQNGFTKCDPGKTAEKTKKKFDPETETYDPEGRLVVKSARWREIPGYHPSDKTMIAHCRFLRTWIDARTKDHC